MCYILVRVLSCVLCWVVVVLVLDMFMCGVCVCWSCSFYVYDGVSLSANAAMYCDAICVLLFVMCMFRCVALSRVALLLFVLFVCFHA